MKKLEIKENTIVYIIAPAGVSTGGPELLHQLASCLRKLGIDARMCYIPQNDPNPVSSVYKKYHVPFVSEVFDEPENIIVIPETRTYLIHTLNKIRRVIWWLSVDFFVSSFYNIMSGYCSSGKYTSIKMPRSFYFEKDESIVHWVQSEYARRFIELNGVDSNQINFVGDYLSIGFLSNNYGVDSADKERWVVYNPAKGYQFTSKLIEAAADIRWIPIKNMTPEEVHALLSLARVYIDFGNHPGRDRIPREAAISGCCIITSKLGAAANDLDVPIPIEYKFEDKDENIPLIIEKIRFLLDNYETETVRLEHYRKIIAEEPKKFVEDVENALEYEKDSATKAALLLPSGADCDDALLKELCDMEDYRLLFVVMEDMDSTEAYCGGVPCINMDDAAFLYKEKRIDKFMVEEQLLSGNVEEHTLKLIDSMGILREDCLLVGKTPE